MAATTLSFLALFLSGTLASPCAPEGVEGNVPVHKVTRTVIETHTVPWGDYNLPSGSGPASSGAHSSTTRSSVSNTSGSTSKTNVGDGSSSTTTYSHGTHTTATSSTLITSTTSSTSPTASSYITYTPVPGYFLQDAESTDPTNFDYALYNFGLINQTYNSSLPSPGLTQWQRFAHELSRLQSAAPSSTSYKLIFMARHGEGNHNAMESYVGTPAWNCYWALLEGANSSFIYADAPVTEDGVEQAVKAREYWRSRIAEEKIPYVESYYSSPMRRCLETAELTFGELELPRSHAFKPVVKEGLREGMSEHTCNRRSTLSWIASNYPSFSFEAGFTEDDELWTGTTTEVSAAQDFRSKQLLDDIFSSDDKTYLSFTSHSGEITSLLRVIGHRPFRLSTGQIIPVLVKAETVTPEEATSTVSSAVWTPSPFCTEPPVTSVPSWGDGGGCVCQSSAEPVITQLPPFPTSQPTPTA